MTKTERTERPDASSAANAADAGLRAVSVQAYLEEVQARLSDPTVLARATELARERGLDLDTLTFGDLDDLVNDAVRADEGSTPG
jgi:hypothetical protein